MRVINNHGLMSTYTITQDDIEAKRKVKRLQMLGIKPRAQYIFYTYCTGRDIKDCEGWWLLHGCSSVVEHW